MSLTTFYLLLFAALLFSPSFSQAPPRNGRGTGMLSPRSPSRLPARNRVVCRRIVFRALSGQCTSTTDPTWGQAGLAQFSYIPGSTARIAAGLDLKSAREISNIVFNQNRDIPNSRKINQLFVFFGQFLDHNLVATPSSERGEALDINVPSNDQHLSPGSTLPFIRSQRGYPSTDADRPINILSSAIDLVAVYGADSIRNGELKEFDSRGKPTGRLKVSVDGEDLLPRNENGLFNAPDSSREFFLAGDHRANEHPVLTALHTVFVREHNFYAKEVEDAMPGLEKELVYEYARKLNVAGFQKIVYEEFYPAIVGRAGQLPRYRGPRRNVNPTVSDIFAGAAFRVGHTMVGERIPRKGRGLRQLSSIPARDTFYKKADEFSNIEMDNVIRGVANTIAQEVDARVVDTLRNQLFEHVPQTEGFDLIALNIQRGRDHNLPKYNEVRSLFGLRRVRDFEDIQCDQETKERLQTAYQDVDDIEAFVGLLAENHVPGSSLGETMIAVWKKEFESLRNGDQFFYLNRNKLERSFPSLLRRRFSRFFQMLRDSRRKLLKEILVIHTGVRPQDLPYADRIFTTSHHR